MDISRVSSGSAWEIDQIAQRGLIDRCIFIVQDQFRSDGLAKIRSVIGADAQPHLHIFSETGRFVDDAAFELSLRTMVDSAIARSKSSSNLAASAFIRAG
jgi:hypothetical protein